MAQASCRARRELDEPWAVVAASGSVAAAAAAGEMCLGVLHANAAGAGAAGAGGACPPADAEDVVDEEDDVLDEVLLVELDLLLRPWLRLPLCVVTALRSPLRSVRVTPSPSFDVLRNLALAFALACPERVRLPNLARPS